MADKSSEAHRLIRKCVGSRIGLLHHCRILLRRLIHRVNCGVDFGKPGGLLFRRCGDRFHVGVDFNNEATDRFQRRACVTDEFHTVVHLCGRVVDQAFDFLGSLCRTLGEFSNFLGNDRKALAGFSRPGRLNAGVESEEVRLKSDLVDNADDVGNLL